AVHLLANRLALDVGHDVVEKPVRFARVEQRQNVRMLQRRRRLDLDDESLGAQHGREFGLQGLDRDLALVLEVVREIDGRHAARTQLALDPVPVGECGAKADRRFANYAGHLGSVACVDTIGTHLSKGGSARPARTNMARLCPTRHSHCTKAPRATVSARGPDAWTAVVFSVWLCRVRYGFGGVFLLPIGLPACITDAPPFQKSASATCQSSLT